MGMLESLSLGFVEGDYSWMDDGSPIDDLILARSFEKPSPGQIIDGLIQSGLIKIREELPLTENSNSSVNQEEWAKRTFSAWSDEDCRRFAQAKQTETSDDLQVTTFLGDLVNPNNPQESQQVIFIAAGGVSEGFLTSQGVSKMRRAMEEAEKLRVPLIFFNAVTSADPSFASEVGQISRQISETMALGLRLTVPKLTVITGEAASAGAHAGWQIADRTLMLDHGALLTVINAEEALDLLHFTSEATRETDGRFTKYLDRLGLSREKEQILRLVKGIDAIEGILAEAKQSESRARIRIENGDALKAIVDVTKEVDPQSKEKIMLIMPADNSRYVTGMLIREADMITIHADDWQKKAEQDSRLTKAEFVEQVRQAMQQAQKIRTREDIQVFFRLNTANFQEFWNTEDVEIILRQLYSTGLSGIRLTETASIGELQKLNDAMRKVEGELGLAAGTFRICLSVENDEAIDQLSQTVKEGDADRRVSAVVMGVRDYIKSKATEKVQDREWSHSLVIQAKQRLAKQVDTLRSQGWDLLNLQAIASPFNDYEIIHREVIAAKTLGADGMLAVAPEQINHARASYEEIFNPDGSINEVRLRDVLAKAKTKIALQIGGSADELIMYYHHLFYEIYHQYRLKLLRAGNAFPEDLRRIGIVDGIIPLQDHELGLPRTLWQNLRDLQSLAPSDIRRERLVKLANLGAKTVRKTKRINPEVRREKAKGRERRSAQFWLDLLTQGEGFREEIIDDLEPDYTFDVLARMGREGTRSYRGQIEEAQARTGTLAGVIAGYITIEEKEILLIVRDQDYINATAGAATGELVRRACLDAVEKKSGRDIQAIIYIDVSAGGRVQEGAFALAPSELALAGLVEAQEAGIKRINIGHTHILGSDGIGPFYCADRIVLIGDETELGLAGRRIVEKTSLRGKGEFPLGFRLAAYHKKVGNVDEVLPAPEKLLVYLKSVLSAES